MSKRRSLSPRISTSEMELVFGWGGGAIVLREVLAGGRERPPEGNDPKRRARLAVLRRDLLLIYRIHVRYFVAMLRVLLCCPPILTMTGTFVPERTPEGTSTLI